MTTAVDAGSAGAQTFPGFRRYVIDVVSTAFAGRGTLAQHRLVLSAVAPLMSGDMAPVHAVDTLTTRVP